MNTFGDIEAVVMLCCHHNLSGVFFYCSVRD